MSDTCDVVVAGAGVGGLALATRLGRLGCRVLVVERRLPSPGAPVPFRVGESLDWEAPIYLRRLGISLEQLVAEGKATATPFWTCSFQDMVAHQSAGENWIAIGEAAFVVDAILSSGVTLALRTGFFAA